MEYRILRTETELETGIQHIMNYASADNFYEARSFLYLFLANAINFSCVIENAHSEGFTQIFSGYKSWKFEIVEYK